MKSSFKSIAALLILISFTLFAGCAPPAQASETKYSDTISQVVVRATNAQSLASQASTFTKVTFATEVVDSRSEFTGNKFTAKSPGLYLVGGTIKFATESDNASRDAVVYLNAAASGIAASTRNVDSTRATIVNAVGLIKLAAGDYLELFARQTSGSAITLDNSTEFFVTKIH